MKIKELLKKIFSDKPDMQEMIDQLEDQENVNVKELVTKNNPVPSAGDESEKINLLVASVEQLKAENKKLVDELLKFKNKEEEREKLLNQKAAHEKKEKIEAAIKKAVEDKKIPAKDEKTIDTYRSLFNADFQRTASVVASLPAITTKADDDKKVNQTNNSPAFSGDENSFKVDRRALQEAIEYEMSTQN